MTSLLFMREEKNCKLALLWIKVKNVLYFSTFVKLGGEFACGLALVFMSIRIWMWIGIKMEFGSGYGSGSSSKLCQSTTLVPYKPSWGWYPVGSSSSRGWILYQCIYHEEKYKKRVLQHCHWINWYFWFARGKCQPIGQDKVLFFFWCSGRIMWPQRVLHNNEFVILYKYMKMLRTIGNSVVGEF